MFHFRGVTPIGQIGDQSGAVTTFGRISRVRNLGGIAFAHLRDQGSEISIVIEGKQVRVRRGDSVVVSGNLERTERTTELHVTSIEYLAECESDTHASSPLIAELQTPLRAEALYLRGAALQAAYRFFLDNSFTPVQSPKIVGPWVVGQTGAFRTDFYGRRAYLSISNMIYHQLLMSSGYSRIFEIGPLFRSERPSSPMRLAEFTIIDIGIAFSNLAGLMDATEALVRSIHSAVLDAPRNVITVPESISFETIAYEDVLNRNKVEQTSGSQLPSSIKRWLSRTFESFVWITGFPQRTRPFFVRSINGVCLDCQLWYQGKQYLAAGGERETHVSTLVAKIRNEGKDPDAYQFYLDAMRHGAPPLVGIGMGLERFLATWTRPCVPASFAFFPRYGDRMEP